MLEVIVVALIISGLFKAMGYVDSQRNIMFLAIAAGSTKVVTSYLASIIEALMVGTNFKTAAVAAFFQLTCDGHQFHFNGDLRTIIVFHDQKIYTLQQRRGS